MAMLKGKLGYLNERQKLIAQNVANADTPGYAPSDLKPFTVEAKIAAPTSSGGVNTAITNSGHLEGKVHAQTAWKVQEQPDSEARLDGNQVVLEDQMIKMNEARMDYEAAVGLYQKSLSMLRMAVRKPGA
ncbi:MAG TPA: flagellar basal body rod protein FlgB [Caulobacteraceae bacterium]|nr:flagellar basal body rod protein FlgB [Caulobacteraceae bacterium]